LLVVARDLVVSSTDRLGLQPLHLRKVVSRNTGMVRSGPSPRRTAIRSGTSKSWNSCTHVRCRRRTQISVRAEYLHKASEEVTESRYRCGAIVEETSPKVEFDREFAHFLRRALLPWRQHVLSLPPNKLIDISQMAPSSSFRGRARLVKQRESTKLPPTKAAGISELLLPRYVAV